MVLTLFYWNIQLVSMIPRSLSMLAGGSAVL